MPRPRTPEPTAGESGNVAALFPPCPSYLKGAAAELWPGVVRKLVQHNDWDDHDSELIVATYCVYAAALSASIQNISERGAVIEASITHVEMHNPHCKTLRDAADGLMRFGTLLNLTPESREYRQHRQQQAARKRAFEQTGRWPP
jgi:P27 family predicted phage terminase small subunit